MSLCHIYVHVTVLSLARFLPDKVKNREAIGNGKLATLQQSMCVHGVCVGGGGAAEFNSLFFLFSLGST